jgi:hypothetical protein
LKKKIKNYKRINIKIKTIVVNMPSVKKKKENNNHNKKNHEKIIIVFLKKN